MGARRRAAIGAHEETPQAREHERGSGRFLLGVIFFAMLIGLCMMRQGIQVGEGPPQPGADSAAQTPRSGDTRGAAALLPPTPAPLPSAHPVKIKIPSITVEAPVIKVGLDARGWIEAPPPKDDNLAGWYRHGPSPGAAGTSVIVGHVDNTAGPAVFYGLGGLRKGSTIAVARADGTTAVFTVYGVEVVEKDNFPSDRVYGDTGHPELRVITCGGGYTKETGYQGNVVVFARLSQTR